MHLKNELPRKFQAALAEFGIDDRDIHIAIETDINAWGAYETQWLVVTRERIFIFDPLQGRTPLYIFDMEEIAEVRAVPAVGSGILQIKVDGIWLDLMRFSNRLKFAFDRVVKRLWQLKWKEPLSVGAGEIDEQDPQRCRSCGLMLEFAGEQCPRCINHGAALTRILGMMKPYWKSASWMMLFLLIGVGLDMAWPLLTRYLVDHVLTRPRVGAPAQHYETLSRFKPETLLVMVVAALAFVHVIRACVNVITGRIASRVGNAMTYDIRGKLVQKLQELGLAYFSKQETGSLVGRIAYDTDAIQSFISQMTSGFLMQFFLVLVSFGMMFSLEPSLAFWAMVPAPFVLGGAFIYWRFVHPRFQRFWDRSSKQAGLLSGILMGIRVVKAFAQEGNELKRFQDASMEVRRTKESLDRTSNFFYPLMAIVFQVGGWIIWYIGGRHVLDDRTSLGTLMAFFGYLSMFYGPLGNLTNLTTWLTQFSTQMHRIFEILDTPAVLPVPMLPADAGPPRGEIEFKDVTFGYSRGNSVIKGMSFKVKPGERIGIVGRSGSGKTSIINLICRFYDVDSGQVLVDGVDVRRISKEDLRSRVSIVLQEPFLFRGSLCENIRYGSPASSLEQVIASSKAACAHEFLMHHPLAYDTSVGERGQELSGGERQRISIARALLCSPKILILDEATSSIDSESELAIQTALDEVASNQTVIIIAHRLSTLQNCDRIYVIESGQIVESGNHRELIALDHRYAHWVRIQQCKAYIEADGDGAVIKEHRKPAEGAGAELVDGVLELPPMGGFRPRWLRPKVDLCERGPRNELQLSVRGEPVYRGVFALRCFPVQFPDRYISLRYVNNEGHIEEIGIIQDLNAWPAEAQALIRGSLDRRYLFHKIEKIYSIRKFSQFLAFSAKTHLGKVEFIMRYAPDAAQEYGKTGKLLMDVEDNLYVLPNIRGLTRAERTMFNRYVYW